MKEKLLTLTLQQMIEKYGHLMDVEDVQTIKSLITPTHNTTIKEQRRIGYSQFDEVVEFTDR